MAFSKSKIKKYNKDKEKDSKVKRYVDKRAEPVDAESLKMGADVPPVAVPVKQKASLFRDIEKTGRKIVRKGQKAAGWPKAFRI